MVDRGRPRWRRIVAGTLGLVVAAFTGYVAAAGQTPSSTPTAEPLPIWLRTPSPPPSGSTPPPAPTVVPLGSPAPSGGAVPLPSGAPAIPPGPAATPIPTPSPSPTPIPLEVSPSPANVTPGGTVVLHLRNAVGMIAIRLYDDKIAAVVDQVAQTVTITGKTAGLSAIDISDGRPMTRSITVRVAQLAGTVGAATSIRLTGDPASNAYVKRQIVAAAAAIASPRPGANVSIDPDAIGLTGSLGQDDTFDVNLPVYLQGEDYFDVTGTTHVHVDNVALPRIRPRSLLVSDYPETLKANGVLFTADLTGDGAERFLYYHYNPPGQPDRKIALLVQNPAPTPAVIQMIDGTAGPSKFEMEVGHLSTQRFLVREAQNEGHLITIPPSSVTTLATQGLPAGDVASSILQLRELSGDTLHLTLLALDAGDPIALPGPGSALLTGTAKHARGIYPIPEFYFDYTYKTDEPSLTVPIGQIPLPNLLQGEALGGDYGVLQSITVRIVNSDARNPAQVALFANPRGGKATGTFLIDRTLVQAHAMPTYGFYKLREYVIPPGGVVRTQIVTMPEGGSSYPLDLIVGPDDGSASPGSPESLVY
ncbi:MAG: hypothetical protein ACREM8_03815 [Vulcanimicrobiaceae bacterium]